MQVQASPSNSATQAGQTEKALSPKTIEAINGVFLLLSTNYGNQFNSAYPNTERSNIAKRLWAKHFSRYPVNLLMKVADDIIGKETFLPSIAKFKEYCDKSYDAFGLLPVESAYIEACRAPQPKKDFNWSHTAVYFAGLATDWFFLSSEPKDKVFPVFKRNYEMLCERVIKGETLNIPIKKALPADISTPLTRTEKQQHLLQLREQLKL